MGKRRRWEEQPFPALITGQPPHTVSSTLLYCDDPACTCQSHLDTGCALPPGLIRDYYESHEACPPISGLAGQGACSSFTCSTGLGGEDCAACEPVPLTGFNRCEKCNAGSVFSAANKTCSCPAGSALEPTGVVRQCKEFQCKLGLGPYDCKGCSLTGPNRCGSCNDDGVLLGNYSCVPAANWTSFNCTVGPGPADCATCPDPALVHVHRDDQCATCNPGSHLMAADHSCRTFTCETGSRSDQCQTCAPVLTADDQCATCNLGGYLNASTQRCDAWQCATGPGKSQCASCLSQALRTGPDQCATCNDGASLDRINKKCRDGLCGAHKLDPTLFTESEPGGCLAAPLAGESACSLGSCGHYDKAGGRTCCRRAVYGEYVRQFVKELGWGTMADQQNETYLQRSIPTIARYRRDPNPNPSCHRAVNTFYCMWCSPDSDKFVEELEPELLLPKQVSESTTTSVANPVQVIPGAPGQPPRVITKKITSVVTTRTTADAASTTERRRLVVRLCPKVCRLLEPCYGDYHQARLPGGDAFEACKADLRRMSEKKFYSAYFDKAEADELKAYKYVEVQFTLLESQGGRGDAADEDEEGGENCFSLAGERATGAPAGAVLVGALAAIAAAQQFVR